MRVSLRRILLMIAFFALPAGAAGSEWRWSGSLAAGGAAELPATLEEFDSAGNDLTKVSEFLDRRYGTFEEANADLELRAEHLWDLGSDGNWRLGAGIFSDSTLFGSVDNPVVPELHVLIAAQAGLVATAGILFPEAQVDVSLRLPVGFGREKRLDAVGTDFIDKAPIRDGSITSLAPELSVAREFSLDDDWSLSTGGSLRNSFFWNESSEEQPIRVFRWRGEAEVSRRFSRMETGIGMIAGPQPLPSGVLPGIWDYSHQPVPWADLGTLLGAGARVRLEPFNPSRIEIRAGYFGGYLGGQVALSYGAVSLIGSSYGVEGSSFFHLMGQRIWGASLSFEL